MQGLRSLHGPLWVFRAVLAGVAGAIPLVAKLPEAKVDQYVAWATGFPAWCDAWQWITIPSSLALAATVGFFGAVIGDPEAYSSAKQLLDDLHGLMFPDAQDDHCRLTLFRFSRWSHAFKLWPWWSRKGGWLIPVMRSGDMHQDFNACFKVTDDPDNSQGVAGQAWCSRADVYIPELPLVSGKSLKRRAVSNYAKLTSVSEDWVRRRRPKSRSLYAMKIKGKKGKWGVVVVDSTEPQLDVDRISEVFRHTQSALSLLATKV